MKKLFWTGLIGAILAATAAGALAQPLAGLIGDKEQKQKVRIIVVDKKQPGSSNQSQKPRTEDRNRKP